MSLTGTFDGATSLEVPGFSYLTRFITEAEGAALIEYFGSVTPLWENRHSGNASGRSETGSRRLTRPVYWLGAWQFACLGYYALPGHLEHKCLRAEPFPAVMQQILDRLLPHLKHHGAPASTPNTCLINYYGSELSRDVHGKLQPVDYARLRMHRDGEPGPVVMFSVGQPALFEFVDPEKPDAPEVSLWLKNRSVVILSGAHFKDTLYHRVTRVRHGKDPAMSARVPDFRLRRVSVSFRYVPEAHIEDLRDFPQEKRDEIRRYVVQLAEQSAHFRTQLT